MPRPGTLKNDKEPRTLPLKLSVYSIKHCIEQHTRIDDPDAPLFVALQNGYSRRQSCLCMLMLIELWCGLKVIPEIVRCGIAQAGFDVGAVPAEW